MEDIIDIIVTETTNTIEITSQSTDEVIDVNIIDNREDITLNVTSTVVEININSLTGNFGVAWGQITGTLSNQTDLNTALGLKADLVAGKVPSSQLPSYVDDVVEVANYAALPATGETGKIYVTIDTNYIYRWTGSVYVEIKDSSAVWGAITGTLSFQNDLQSALNAKFDDPTGDTTQYIAGDGSLITFPVAGQSGTLVREVRNTTGATLTKGTIVYISGATGNKPTVSKAIATGDSTSAQTFGMCQANIANNSNGYVVCVGDITGLDTSALTEGAQLYLSSTTAGTYTTTKQLAPAHLVYIGVVTRSHPNQGQIEVKIQNGYELDEIHDVAISSVANNQGIFYESSTSLWKNKSIATVLGYTPEQPLTFNSPLSRSTNTVSIPAATSSANGYLTSTDWSTFNGKANDADVVKLTGNQTIAGVKTFSDNLKLDGDFYIKQDSTFGTIAGYNAITADTGGFYLRTPTSTIYAYLAFNNLTTYQNFSFPNATGTLALTSDLASYLPLSGGTLTGALSGTSASFSSTISSIRNTSANVSVTIANSYINQGNLINFQQNKAGSTINAYIGHGGDNTGNFIINNGTQAITITNAGNVGIGTTSPSKLLSVYSSATTNTAQVVISDTSTSKLYLGTFSNNAYLSYGGTYASGWSADGTNSIAVINMTAANNDSTISFATSQTNGVGPSERMRITSGGNVLVGTTSDNGAKLQVSGTSTYTGNMDIGNAYLNFSYSDQGIKMSKYNVGAKNALWASSQQYLFLGTTETNSWERIYVIATSNGVYIPSGGVAWIANSDERLKTDLVPIENATNKVSQLRSVIGRYKTDEEGIKRPFLIAQDVLKVLPEAVNVNKETGELGVSYSEVIPLLVASIKELKSKIEILEKK